MRIVLFLALVGCDDQVFDPPSVPAHDRMQEGYAHARGLETPFLCGEPGSGRRVACDGPVDRADLSCDAAGCHGSAEYTAADGERALHGSDGPSCFTCHNREWSNRLE